MEFLLPLSILIAWFGGILLGSILVSISPEEQRPLKKRVLLLQKCLLWASPLVLVLGFLLDFFSIRTLPIVLFALCMAVLILMHLKWKNAPQDLLLPLCLGFSSVNREAFSAELALAAVYCITVGILLANKKQKNLFGVLLSNWHFPAAGIAAVLAVQAIVFGV